MAILPMILAIALCGFIVWIILQIPMPEQFRKVIIAVACVVLILYILQAFGVNVGLSTLRIK